MLNTILGIETSCDETGIAIYQTDNGCISSVLHSQTETHLKFGGVVPELASRDHVLYLPYLFKECLDKAKLTINEIDGIAYTQGPGLASALLTGSSFASALAWSRKIPCIPVHHLEGHLLSPLLENPSLEPPFLALLISGGHTLLIKVDHLGKYSILGQTLDDAVGEAFDKSAKLLGLGYPGGYALSQLAKKGNPKSLKFTRPLTARRGGKLLQENRLNFSFSGLKTEVRNAYLNQKENTENIAASFEETVADTLRIKLKIALEQESVQQLVVAGGVAANSKIREYLTTLAETNKVNVFIPSPKLCTDNGEMIALVGWLRFNDKNRSSKQQKNYSFNALPRWDISDLESIK